MQVNPQYQLTLKIKNKYIDIKLNLNDTKPIIYQKIMQVCPQQKLDLNDLVNKIKKQLVTVSSRVEAQNEARLVARDIVSKIYNEEKSPLHSEWAISEIAGNSRVKSCASDLLILPEKVCYQKYIQTEQTQLIEQKSSKCSNSKSFISQSLNKKQTESELGKRVNTSKDQKMQQKEKKSSKQSGNKKKCNPDMIKACEAIMKKSNHNTMKIMAKEFLKEKGYLAEDSFSHQRDKRRSYFVLQVSQNPQHQRPQRQQQNQKIRQETSQSNVLVESKSENLIQTSNKKGRSKFHYNITPNSDIYSYSLNASYQNEPRIRMTETSVQRCVKKYNYLQN